MSVVATVIASAAVKVGAELVGKAVSGLFGDKGGEIADTVIGSVADKLGVPAEQIATAPAKDVEAAVKATEGDMPDIIALWARGLDGQFALLEAETHEGFWQAAWRWGWMYLLAFFWTCYIIAFPVAAALGWPVDRVDASILLTLTTWFISLYMGGHTVKALGESAIAAVRSWKDHK